jgi:ABC-2 type transport system ATP-binding protein
MIRTLGLTKRFAARRKRGQKEPNAIIAVKDLTLEVQQGEVLGFLGPNGAGKTTTVRMLCALIAPTAGEAWIAGHKLGEGNAAIRASVGILTESPGLYDKLDAVTNLSFFAKLHCVADLEGQVRKYLQMLGLWERRSEPVARFSKGMRQKLAIARALLHEPRLLFLDEPTSGLDPEAARVVRDFIEELRDQGRTIWLCTHNLDEADRLCDRIALIQRSLIRVDSPAGLRQSLYGTTVTVQLREVRPEYLAVVEALDFVRKARSVDQGLSVQLDDPLAHNPVVIRALVEAGAEVVYVQEVEHSLEAVYFDLLAQTREETAA